MAGSRQTILVHHETVLYTGAGSGRAFFQPENIVDYSCADSQGVTHQLDVHGITGSADSWDLVCRHKLGMWDTTGYGWSNPRWYYMDDDQIATLIVEGSEFGRGTQADTVYTNYAQNPSLEVGVSNWATSSASGVTWTNSRESSGGYSGQFFRRSLASGNASAVGGGQYLNGIAITAGDTYSVGAAARFHNAAGGQRLRIGLGFYDGSAVQIGSTTFGTAASYDADDWHWFKLENQVAPVGAATCRVSISPTSGTGYNAWLNGDYFDMDAVIVTDGAALPYEAEYFDGSQDRCVWSSTPGSSTSTMTIPGSVVARHTDRLPVTVSRTIRNFGSLVGLEIRPVAVNPSADFGVTYSLTSTYGIR